MMARVRVARSKARHRRGTATLLALVAMAPMLSGCDGLLRSLGLAKEKPKIAQPAPPPAPPQAPKPPPPKPTEAPPPVAAPRVSVEAERITPDGRSTPIPQIKAPPRVAADASTRTASAVTKPDSAPSGSVEAQNAGAPGGMEAALTALRAVRQPCPSVLSAAQAPSGTVVLHCSNRKTYRVYQDPTGTTKVELVY